VRLCDEDGTWDVSGEMEGVVVIGGDDDASGASAGAGAASLGWAPTRLQTWRHVLDAERRAKIHRGLAAHHLFPGARSPAYTQAHLGQSERDMPAHLGFTLTTSFMFDTRPEPPLFTASIALDDLALGCLVISLKAGGVLRVDKHEHSTDVVFLDTYRARATSVSMKIHLEGSHAPILDDRVLVLNQ